MEPAEMDANMLGLAAPNPRLIYCKITRANLWVQAFLRAFRLGCRARLTAFLALAGGGICRDRCKARSSRFWVSAAL